MEFYDIMEGKSVQLVRGGPEMLIKTVNSEGISCTWYDPVFRVHRNGLFHPDDLRVFEADKQPVSSTLN